MIHAVATGLVIFGCVSAVRLRMFGFAVGFGVLGTLLLFGYE